MQAAPIYAYDFLPYRLCSKVAHGSEVKIRMLYEFPGHGASPEERRRSGHGGTFFTGYILAGRKEWAAMNDVTARTHHIRALITHRGLAQAYAMT